MFDFIHKELNCANGLVIKYMESNAPKHYKRDQKESSHFAAIRRKLFTTSSKDSFFSHNK